MHLRLDQYLSPLSTLLLVTDDDGALRALDFADHQLANAATTARTLR